MSCGCNNNGVLGVADNVCDNGVLGAFGNNGFLLLLLLFILLACGFGRENNFFFIIILAIIAFGGFGRTFGFGV